jgi:hypothetical protein
MSGLAQMLVFDAVGTLAIFAVLIAAPDGPRPRKRGKR